MATKPPVSSLPKATPANGAKRASPARKPPVHTIGDARELPPPTPPRTHRRTRHGFDSADLAVLLALSALALAVVLLSAATH